MTTNSFDTLAELDTGTGKARFHSLARLERPVVSICRLEDRSSLVVVPEPRDRTSDVPADPGLSDAITGRNMCDDFRHSPGAPGVVFSGARFVGVAKWTLPLPP